MPEEKIKLMIENEVRKHHESCMEKIEAIIIRTINAEIGKKMLAIMGLIIIQLTITILNFYLKFQK